MITPGVDVSAWERFFSKIEVVGDCWIWVGSREPKGYGKFMAGDKAGKPRSTAGNRVPVKAHRFVHELLGLPCPPDKTWDHSCQQKPCVNPDHGEWVTNKVNQLRGGGVGGTNARKTVWPRCGGPYKDVRRPNGTQASMRGCPACGARSSRERQAWLEATGRTHEEWHAAVTVRRAWDKIPRPLL